MKSMKSGSNRSHVLKEYIATVLSFRTRYISVYFFSSSCIFFSKSHTKSSSSDVPFIFSKTNQSLFFENPSTQSSTFIAFSNGYFEIFFDTKVFVPSYSIFLSFISTSSILRRADTPLSLSSLVRLSRISRELKKSIVMPQRYLSDSMNSSILWSFQRNSLICENL